MSEVWLRPLPSVGVERCATHPLTLVTPRDHARRGSHVSFRHPQGYAVMQALIFVVVVNVVITVCVVPVIEFKNVTAEGFRDASFSIGAGVACKLVTESDLDRGLLMHLLLGSERPVSGEVVLFRGTHRGAPGGTAAAAPLEDGHRVGHRGVSTLGRGAYAAAYM